MGFRINTRATLANVNPRKENHGDDSVTALDLKFEAEGVSAETVFPLLGIQGDDEAQKAFRQCFWNDAEPRFSGLDSIECWAKFEDSHHLTGTLAAVKVDTDKIHKFRFKPRSSHRVDLIFVVVVVDPDDSFIENAIHAMKDLITVEIDHEPELDLSAEAA